MIECTFYEYDHPHFAWSSKHPLDFPHHFGDLAIIVEYELRKMGNFHLPDLLDA